MRHLVVVEPSLSPADADLLARLAQETGKSASEWEHLLIGSPSMARVVGGSDDVRDAHELAGKVDFCGLQARVVRVDDVKAAVTRMKEVVALERAPRSHGAFRAQLADGGTLEITHRDLRALVSGRQMRRGHEHIFLALVRSSEPLVIVVRAPGTRIDALVPHAHSPELALGELLALLIEAAPRVAVERGLERAGAKTGVAELDDLAAAVAISAWVATAAPSDSAADAPIDVNSLFGLPPSGAPAATTPAPAPGASLDLATEPRRAMRAEPAPFDAPFDAPFAAPRESAPFSNDTAPADSNGEQRPEAGPEVRGRRARPPRPPKAASPVDRALALRTDKPAVFYGAIAAVVLVLLLAIFGRGTPNVAAHKLSKGDTWNTPYGVAFTFDSAFDASVGGEHVVGMSVTASKKSEKETFRISGYDATRDRVAFEVPFKLAEHDDQGASWIKIEARKPSP